MTSGSVEVKPFSKIRITINDTVSPQTQTQTGNHLIITGYNGYHIIIWYIMEHAQYNQISQLAECTLTILLCNLSASASVGSKEFRFWRKTDKITKIGRRGENIDFWRNLTKFDEIAELRDLRHSFWRNLHFDDRKMAFLVAESGGDLEKALSHKFNRVTF